MRSQDQEPPVPPHRAASPISPPMDPRGGRRPYGAPTLKGYGDLRSLTLGPSPGIGESGNPAIFRA